ncbi:MAG: stage V sporulation protein K [Firmicutes bacterium]|nr:stage V sporulation protein K [Bacillota bacterium]MCL5038903.1 stage V sporulation protein K [Bacillota bacterium]
MEKKEDEMGRPTSLEEVFDWLGAGKISSSEAFGLFQEVEKGALAEPDRTNQKGLEEAMKELDSLIGLTEVKELVKEIQAFVEIQRRRAKENLVSEPLVLHMIFKGNPGTGKTTVARILGKIFREMGVLQRGHLVEVERADLVGEYIGHTAQKTREQIKRALGGILFIDEAYALARGGEKDFGKEAIDTLVKSMEDHRDNLILILAGYLQEMETFVRTNPGLRSRFPIHIDFPDYDVQELLEIAELLLKKRQYRFSPEAREVLTASLLQKTASKESHFGNARLVRNIIEKSLRQQAVRLVGRDRLTRDDLMLITRSDILGALD